MVEIYIVRHGETQHNIDKLVQGWCDSPLTSKGEAQAKILGEQMRHIPFATAYAGDLGRQQSTASIILSENITGCGTELKTDPRFREIGFGSFEGKKQDELVSKLGQALDVKADRFEDILNHCSQKDISGLIASSDPDKRAETGEECCSRFTEGLLEAASESESKAGTEPQITHILVVSSGAVMGLMMEKLDPDGRYTHLMGNADAIIVEIENSELSLKEYKAFDPGI